MSDTTNADPAADGTAWHAMATDEVIKHLTTAAGKGLAAAGQLAVL